MDIKEVIENCNNGDYVIDNNNRKWKVDKGDLTNKTGFIFDIYNLKELFDLQFKKADETDWSKVTVDTKILVSNNNNIWHKRHFAKYENDKVFAFMNGTTSYTDNTCTTWKYAKLYKEEDHKIKCVDCKKDIKSVKQYCNECGVLLCKSCFENGEKGLCKECEYENDGMC